MFWSDDDAELPALAAAALRFLATDKDYHRPLLDRWLPERGTIAEVGCGLGRVANFCDRPGRRAIGLDLDLVALKAARMLQGTPYVCADALVLPFADGVLAAHVGLGIVEFDPDGGSAALREAHRVLRPGGLLYLTVAFRNLQRRRTGRVRWHGYDLRSYTREDVERLLTDTGFALRLIRPSSLAWGLGPLRPAARLLPRALVREDERALSYRLLFPLVRHLANSLLVVAHKAE
jgi:SAM-dependent methyltransferase